MMTNKPLPGGVSVMKTHIIPNDHIFRQILLHHVSFVITDEVPVKCVQVCNEMLCVIEPYNGNMYKHTIF